MTKRTWRLLTLAMLASVSLAASASAATYTVGTTNDTTPGTACTPSSGTCSLRELIESENSLAASASGDTIIVPANLYSLTNGPLSITHSITVNGAGPRNTEIFQETTTSTSRVFDLQVCPPSGVGCPATTPLPVVTIAGIGVFFGKADSTNGFAGGNIRNLDKLTLTDDVVAYGGTTNGSGAGISNDGGVLSVTRSLIENNGASTTNDSGGIRNFGPNPVTGAAGRLTVSNSTVYANTSAQGGGIMSWCGGSGGACSTDGSSLSTTIVNSTITGNSGGARGTTGGGVLDTGGTTTLQNTIIANNTVDNPAPGTSSNCGVGSGAAINSLGHNLAFPGTDCPLTATGDLQNTDPKFIFAGPQDLGGATDVIALHAASPAVDAIPASAAGCSGVDQRTLARPQGSGCDIGAFELFQAVEGQSFTTLVGTVSAQSGSTPTIDWGDGTAASMSSYDTTTGHVTGTHTYAEEGNYSGTINYINSDGSPSSLPFDLKVRDAPLTATGTTVRAVPATAFTGTVATFTDADPAGTASDYTATIDWGDGSSPSTGTITAGPNGFRVDGTHTYASANTDTINVTIRDTGGSTAAARTTANVSALRPVLVSGPPSVGASTSAGFSGSVNPEGLSTLVHFEYGLDAKYGFPGAAIAPDQSTPSVPAGSDFSVHQISTSVAGLVPNALYHVRMVATNSAGSSFGSEQTFTTLKDPAPPAPVLGRQVNITPLSGLVLVKFPGSHSAPDRVSANALSKGQGFIPLTEARQLPTGTEVDARQGTLKLITATATHGKTQSGVFSTGLFKLTQQRHGLTKGLTTLNLLEGAFPGAPTYATCKAHAATDTTGPTATTARLSRSILQTLHARDNHGRFRTKGRYSAGTVRGTQWDTIDRCDGTLTTVHRGTVSVRDFKRRKTILVHAHHSYLARAIRTRRHK